MAVDDLGRLLVSRVARAERLGRAWLEPRLAEHGISYAEFRLVGLLLGEPEGITQRELAERLGVRAATVSVALAQLEGRGVVERVADPDDARAKRVRVAGAVPEMPAAARALGELEGRALAGISKRDAAVAKRVLERVADNLERGEP